MKKFLKFVFVIGLFSLFLNNKSVNRILNVNNGNCEWSEPIIDSKNSSDEVQATLITGFPRVGKGLVSAIIEQFTNRKVCDDISGETGENVVGMKTNFPYPEAIWDWDETMYQSLLVIRNPMDSIRSHFKHMMKANKPPPSYSSLLLNEVDKLYTNRSRFSFNYRKRLKEINSKETDIGAWYIWRDAEFDIEMDSYGSIIDYWMGNGRRRDLWYDDPNCKEKMLGTCIPKAVIEYEALKDPERNQQEITKIASVLNNTTGVPIIDQSGWMCAYRSMLEKNKKNTTKEKDVSYPFSCQQLGIMRRELQRLHNKYVGLEYKNVLVAAQLVVSLKRFLVDVTFAFHEVWDVNEKDTT